MDSLQAYDDDYYYLSYEYLESKNQILVNMMNYLRLQSSYNREKEFKFAIVVTEHANRRGDNTRRMRETTQDRAGLGNFSASVFSRSEDMNESVSDPNLT